MKKRLFLTGPMGCGKSTAIANAIGKLLPEFGGFLTLRRRDEKGQAVSFYLVSPDGSRQATFLDFSSGKPQVYLDVFESLGVSLLRGSVLILDEIGGIELLCPGFMEALQTLLQSDIPIIGVIKGEGPSGALVQALGLTQAYEAAAADLRQQLMHDPDTLMYECSQYDENALMLAKSWVEAYAYA